MLHGRFIIEDEWRARKDNLPQEITWEKIIKTGIEVFEKEQAEKVEKK